MADGASGTLASDGDSTEVQGLKVDVHLYDSSSFSGTFTVSRYMGGGWRTVATGTEADLPYDKVVDNANIRRVKVTTSSSSGTLGYVLGTA